MEACLVFLVLLSLSSFAPAEGKTFRTCELARALDGQKIPKFLISNFVCVAEAVSRSETSTKTFPTPTRADFGIFQISTKFYCGKNGQVGGICNIKCDKLLDDVIVDDIQCAWKIFEKHGFKYWPRWETRCKSTDPKNYNKYLPNLHNCF